MDTDSQSGVRCPFLSQFWNYSHSSSVVVTQSLFVRNCAEQPGVAVGGGLYGGPGAAFIVAGCTFLDNFAGGLGGGIGLGGSYGASVDTCSLQLVNGSTLAGNTAGHGAGQVYMGCLADMLVQGATVALGSVGTQVGGWQSTRCAGAGAGAKGGGGRS